MSWFCRHDWKVVKIIVLEALIVMSCEKCGRSREYHVTNPTEVDPMESGDDAANSPDT